MKSIAALMLSMVCVLTSCGAGRTIVADPVVIPCHVSTNSVSIVRDRDCVNVCEDVKCTFEKQLSKKLFSDGVLQNGPGVTLKYRFIQYNEGSRFSRYMWGGIGNAGEASVMIEVSYLDPQNNVLGKIQTEGRIGSGLFGGSSDNAIEKAADEVANYTRCIILQNS